MLISSHSLPVARWLTGVEAVGGAMERAQAFAVAVLCSSLCKIGDAA